ncbi:MAG: transposase [Planctomycetota bacterium]|jgi:REP element-mobilizing transposase RayT
MARARDRKPRRWNQRELTFAAWGGVRVGAGRKPKGKKAGVSHGVRVQLASRYPVHVTARLLAGLPRLRNKRVYAVLRAAFMAGCERFGFRLVHYSVQTNHLHLLVEARDRQALSRGLQGLFIRIAKALNRLWARKGTVFADRYHDHILRTPREVRRALAYVLNNGLRHRHRTFCAGGRLAPDLCSSGWWFDGWKDRFTVKGLGRQQKPVAASRTWLLQTGWRRHGLIRLAEVPGPAP